MRSNRSSVDSSQGDLDDPRRGPVLDYVARLQTFLNTARSYVEDVPVQDDDDAEGDRIIEEAWEAIVQRLDADEEAAKEAAEEAAKEKQALEQGGEGTGSKKEKESNLPMRPRLQ